MRETQETEAVRAVHTTNDKDTSAVILKEGESVLTSFFAVPPSPPRKLLDGPKRKKKKTKNHVDGAKLAVQNSLSSFLQGLKSQKK